MVVPPPFVPPLLVRAAKTTFASERSVDKANKATDDDGMNDVSKNAEFFGGEIDRSIFFPHCILYRAYTHVNAKTDKQTDTERETPLLELS